MARIHRVRPGECLSSIAKQYGFADWRTIYNHPENASFRQRRPNPNVIYPGDRIYIPDGEQREESCTTEQCHNFRCKAPRTLLRVVIQDEDGQPVAGKRYQLRIAGREPYQDITGDDGLIEHEIPADVEEGALTVWLDEEASSEGYTWSLKIGHLDPVDEITGIQARLNNLGFPCVDVDGILDPRTKAAVKVFQEKYGLAVDGISGPQTQAKLQEVHGC